VPLNLEIKARIPDFEDALGRASSLPATDAGHLLHVDTYFALSRGRLKLREINASSAELIFYTREEQSERRYSAFERCPVADPALLKKLLTQALGIRGVVAKDRHLFLFRQTTRIHLDRVDRLGAFIEFEVPVADEGGAEREIDRLITHFRLRPEWMITGSYIDLLESGGLG
jgi:adenylate cyclase class IV